MTALRFQTRERRQTSPAFFQGFYKQLDSIIAKIPKTEILLVQGNWNAKVGPDAYQYWAGAVGRAGIGKTNDRRALDEFAESHRLTLANTLHPPPRPESSRIAIWHAPNGQVHNQLDLVLTP